MPTITESERLARYIETLDEKDPETGLSLRYWGVDKYVDGTPVSTFLEAQQKVVNTAMNGGGGSSGSTEDYIQSTDTRDGGGYSPFPDITDEGQPEGNPSNGVRKSDVEGSLPDFEDITGGGGPV